MHKAEAAKSYDELHAEFKQVENKRQEVTKPLFAAYKNANEAFESVKARIRADWAAIRATVTDLPMSKRMAEVRVVDQALVPSEFWVVDEAAVRLAVASGRDVPGIEIVYEDHVLVPKEWRALEGK